MLTVHELIQKLQAIDRQDAVVFFGPEEGAPDLIQGGVRPDRGDKPPVLILCPTKLDQVGGF